MGRQLCTNKAPVVNEQTNQQKQEEKGMKGKHKFRTKDKKRA